MFIAKNETDSNMNNQGLSFRLSNDFLEIRRVVLVPSLSLLRFLKINKVLSSSRTAPVILDCYSPLFLDSETLLITPFMGADGVSYLLNLLLKGKKDTSVFFIGYAGMIAEETADTGSCFISEISNYLVEQNINHIEYLSTESPPGRSNILLSTRYPHEESLEKIKNIHATYGISLIDMECAFIKSVCSDLGASFSPLLIIRDIWDISKGTHRILKSPLGDEVSFALVNDFFSW